MGTITTWVLVIGASINVQAGDPRWVREAGPSLWAKFLVGGFPREEMCQRAAREAATQLQHKMGPLAFRSAHCEPYTVTLTQKIAD